MSYCVTWARRFLMRSAACFRVMRFRQSGQYLTLLELEAKDAPQTAQRRKSSRWQSSAYSSLSSGRTAARNHLHSSEQEISCGQTHVSPSSSNRQFPLSQLQHDFLIRALTFRLCWGVSRLISLIRPRRRKRQAPHTPLRSGRRSSARRVPPAPAYPRP